MSRRAVSVAGGAAALFLLLHLPYLPKSLEDVDSINFALGVREFDVAHHQPHPPGYPVFIALAKAVHAAGVSEVHALAILGIVAASLGLLALLVFFTAIDRNAPVRAFAATALAVGAPLYWLTASRPLTDATGLAVAVGIQALIITAASDRTLVAASFLAAFATGLRSQVAWLTVPLLVFVVARRVADRRFRVLPAAAAFVIGASAWAVPLMMFTGGPLGYWRAVANQGNEDLTNIVMLWTTHTAREVEQSLYYAFVSPWAVTALAAVVLALAVIGIMIGLRRRPTVLLTLAVAYGPYLFFDLVFQETITTRYALPLVVPVAYLAAWGAEAAGPAAGAAAVAMIAVFSMHIGGTSLAAYASQPAPVFRMLDGMKSEASVPGSLPVLATHRREDFDLRRPLQWAGVLPLAGRLQAPPKHEWMEVVKYWNGGGRNPVWFVADPLRSDLALFGLRQTPESFRYTLEYPILLGGTRPYEMDWHVIPPPDWYVGEGWALTPESAGVAKEDRRGPGYAPIRGWIRRWPAASALVVGGRNLAAGGPPAHVAIALDGRTVDAVDVAPGFFLREIDLPSGALAGAGDYASLTIAADSTELAVEQLDAATADRILVGYGDGWHEQEYNPATGKVWRWTSDHGALRVRTPKQGLVLELTGEVEAASRSRVTIRAGARVVAAQDVGETFSLRQVIPKELVVDGDNTITITTDQTYVPAERRRRTADRRLLGLKVYVCRVTPAS